jgi:hypothetical protein
VPSVRILTDFRRADLHLDIPFSHRRCRKPLLITLPHDHHSGEWYPPDLPLPESRAFLSCDIFAGVNQLF